MTQQRPCPGPDSGTPCPGTGFIEADRGATAERCKLCAVLRSNKKNAENRRKMRAATRAARRRATN